MKLKRILVAIFCLAAVFALVGCNESGSTNSGGTKVVFELEGGTYKNSTYAITHTYKLEEGEETYIVTPEQLNKNKYDVKRSGYSLVGWFRSKSGEGESAEPVKTRLFDKLAKLGKVIIRLTGEADHCGGP